MPVFREADASRLAVIKASFLPAGCVKAEVAYGLVGIAGVAFCPQEPLSYFAKTSIMEKNQERLFPEFPSVSTQEWMDVIVKDLKGADFNKKLVWKTPEGFDVNPFYRKEDLEHIEYLDARPGDFPYVRGHNGEANNWEIRQDFRLEDISACNALAAQAAAKGADSVGLDVRKVSTLEEMEQLLQGIDPTRTGIHFIGSTDYAKTLGLFVEYLDKKKIPADKVSGSIDFDPFHYALLHGRFYGSLDANIEETVQLFKQYAGKLPHFRLLAVNAASLHDAGAYNVEEMGFALNWACDYFSKLTDKGLDIDTLASRTTLVLAIGSDYFMEIAKLRAMRLLWGYMVDGFKPKEEKSKVPFIHARTSFWNKSVYDPYVNMLRSTTETMSAAIGGADSICVSDFSEAFRPADEFSARIARNQQVILKEESFFNRIVDPAAGSYYVENLTLNLAQQAWKRFLETEEKGGFAACIQSGAVADAVEACAAKRDADLAKRKTVLTGVNQYPNLNETEMDHIAVPAFSGNAKGDAEAEGKNEGGFKAIRPYRGAEAFEKLRLETEAYQKKTGKRPKVFLLTYGNLAMRKARAGFATNFFGCLGYEIIDNPGFENGKQGAEAALASGAEVTVLCSSDEEYAALAAEACPILKGKTHIVYAGMAADEAPFRELGVSDFIHVRSNVLETLAKFQKELL